MHRFVATVALFLLFVGAGFAETNDADTGMIGEPISARNLKKGGKRGRRLATKTPKPPAATKSPKPPAATKSPKRGRRLATKAPKAPKAPKK